VQQELLSHRNSISTMLLSSPLKFTGELQSWLPWVIKIRFVIITFVFAIDYAIRVVVPTPSNLASIKYVGIVVVLWYTVGLFFLIYNQVSRDYLLQAYLQLYFDIAIITALVHVTGDLESHYQSLYLVAILLASVVLPRASVFLVAGVSFVFMGSLLELAYLPSQIYPELIHQYPALGIFSTMSQTQVDLPTLQIRISVTLFGYFAVAYLASYLAESLRKTGAELRNQRGQVASLQAIYENIVQSMRDGLITTDLDGNIRDLNPAGASILGHKPGDLQGKPILTVFERVQVDGSSSLPRREINYKHPDGELRTLGLAASPLVVSDVGMVGIVYNFQDLTEEKRLEAEYHAKDRMATLGRLSAGIAHEIRNPLASIAGSVRLLRSMANLTDDEGKLVDIVSNESERLNKLVTDFLAYTPDQRMEFSQVDLTNLLEETLVLIEHHPLFRESHRIERKLPRQPVMAWVDADRVRQIFWNICDNALKAMPDGGTLTAEIQSSGGAHARVILADTGVGFAPAQMEKLFEPFQTGFERGTGLGLAIVYQIVVGHRGRIQVDSKPGKGARFIVDLPRTAPVESVAAN
jgi:two-component system, NtrC family, sensor histidine kinase PilS